MNFKKLVTKLFLLCSIITVGFASNAYAAVIGSVNSNNVNVRSEASTSGVRIETISEGTEVEITEQSGDWYKVVYGKVGGAYISAQYVSIVQATGTVTDNHVNVRNASNTSSTIVAQVNEGDTITITGQSGDWYRIRRSNGDTAYVNKAFVTGMLLSEIPGFNVSASATVNTYAIVTSTTGLNFRETGSTTGKVIAVLPYDTVVDVIESGSEWLKVRTESGTVGYLNAEFASVRTGEKPSRSISSKGEQVVAYGKQFLGTPYAWGGTNLSKGVDCSGFVYSVMKNFGVSLNRSSAAMASNGVYVERSALQAGDLVFFDTTNAKNQGYISHVGIYMGDGKIIHSSSGKQWGVTINSLSEVYYDTKYVTARRVLR